MQPTIFASFASADAVERIIGALLEAGAAPEDLSAIINVEHSFQNSNNGQMGALELALAMVDSGEAATASYGQPGLESEGSYVFESRVGGGISTSDPDDDVSAIEEMDDSQEAAEQISYPASTTSFGSNDIHDVALGANKGFFGTTRPGRLGLGGLVLGERSPVGESSLSSLDVPGVGLVLGDGNLATTVIGAGLAAQRAGGPAADIQDYLTDQGVEESDAWLFAKDFEKGGAVLSVAVPPGFVDSGPLQAALESAGAWNVRLVEAVD